MKYQIRIVSDTEIKPKLTFEDSSIDEVLKSLKEMDESKEGQSIVGYYIQKVED